MVSELLSEEKKESETVLLEFLRRTKNGEYAPIDPESLNYIRLKEHTASDEQEFYYGLS